MSVLLVHFPLLAQLLLLFFVLFRELHVVQAVQEVVLLGLIEKLVLSAPELLRVLNYFLVFEVVATLL